MRTAIPALCALVLTLAAAPVHGQSGCDQNGNGEIGVYFDAAGTRPCGVLPIGPNTLYLLGRPAGASISGIQGAEFRIEVTAPANWLLQFEPAPDVTIALGTAFDTQPANSSNPSGINIAYDTCRTGLVQFGTVLAFPLPGALPTELIVRRKEPSSNPAHRAPVFTLCDAPFYTQVDLTPTEDVLGREPALSRSGLGMTECPACGAGLPCSDAGSDGLIGVYADAAASDACLNVPPGQERTAYVVATLAGATASGLRAARFRIEVPNPAGYTFTWQPSPEANFASGDPVDTTPMPFDTRGVVMTFGICANPLSRRVVLGTLLIQNQSGGPTELWVRGPSPFDAPGNACATLTACDGPSSICLTQKQPLREPLLSRSSLNLQPCVACPEPAPPPPLPPCADVAQNGTIAVSASVANLDGCIAAPPFTAVGATVVALLDGSSAGGITGADFRIELSNPAGYLFQWTPSAALNVTLGSPLDETPDNAADARGAVLGFPTCQIGVGARVALGTIQILNLGSGASCELRTKRRNPPANAALQCPFVVLCDGPVFSALCLTPGDTELGREGVAFRGTVNGDPCVSCGISGPVGVTTRSWSQVKEMFR